MTMLTNVKSYPLETMILPPRYDAKANPPFQAADRQPKTPALARGGRTSLMKVESIGQAIEILA